MTRLRKTVLITGATSGIGKCLAKQFSQPGYNLAICGRDEEKMITLRSELKTPTDRLYTECFSITDEEDIISFVKSAERKFGTIDILINNAGVNSSRKRVEELDTNALDYMYSINFRAPFIFMKEVTTGMKQKKTGIIINILSTVCLFSNHYIGAYTATKSGFDALTKVFRKEIQQFGIKVCSVYPGGVNTPFRDKERPEYMKPESVAAAIGNLLLLPEDVIPHELVIRPQVENNF